MAMRRVKRLRALLTRFGGTDDGIDFEWSLCGDGHLFSGYASPVGATKPGPVLKLA